MTINRLKADGFMSQAVVANGFVFLAGQVATEDPSADVEDQTRQILSTIEGLLTAAGTCKERILTATVYLADISSFDLMNRAWDVWVSKETPPARATVEAKLAAPQYKVEVQVIAAL